MKYKIEKNTVQETLILPLYSRKLCTELYPNLYRDERSRRRDRLCAAVYPCLRRTLLRLRISKETSMRWSSIEIL